MLYKIRNAKSNPQNESVNEGKKAEKDFDGDGKLESPEAEYKGSKDKAIKKELKDLQKAAETGKGEYVAKADKVKGVGESVEADKYIETVQQIKKGELEDDIKRWEQLTSSGKFTKEEIENLAWNEFDEGYQRDPEGGEEKERKRKREQKGGYDEKRERRMNDPKTGINSPAFREFMRSRGM